MGEIRSALEIALEKTKGLASPTEEERLKWKYAPEGEKIGIRYLKEDCSLVAELSGFEERVRKYAAEGASAILIRSLTLPRDEPAKKSNKKLMDGIKVLKRDKIGVENVFSKMRRIFNHYTNEGEQQRKQAFANLKTDFEKKMQQAAQQQLNFAGARVNIENTPQFQAEWRKLRQQLDESYLQYLEEFKRELSALA